MKPLLLGAVLALALLVAVLGCLAARRRPAGAHGQAQAGPGLCLWTGLLLAGVFVSWVVGRALGAGHDSTLTYALRLLDSAHTDSWAPMIDAIRQLREHPQQAVYQTIFFERRVKFQYPLSALLFLDYPQAWTGWSWPRMVRVSNEFSRLCVAGVCATLFFLWSGAQRTPGGAPADPSVRERVAMAGLCVAATLLYYPLTRSFYLGQIQTAMTLAMALALLAWQRGRPVPSGLLVGLCCAIKPHLALLIAWAALRRQWRFALAAAATLGAFGLLSVLAYGWDQVLGYVGVVSYLGQHGESFMANQSVNGLVNRWLFNGNNLEWLGQAFAPPHPLVRGLTVASSLLLLGLMLAWPTAQPPTALELGLAMLSLTIASPIAWEHHYAIVLPILVLIAPQALRSRPFGRFTVVALGLAFLLTSQNLADVTGLLAASRWNVLQSFLFFGALLLLVLLYRMSWQARRAAVPTV